MKTKSIMLIAVSLGFGLVAAIGMSQVLGQKNGDAKEVEMTQVFVALVPMEIGDGLNEDNLKVSRRPVTEVPENSISSFEELKNMVVIQKIPKDLVIVSDFIVDRNEARLRKQPPSGFKAYCLKTSLEDLTHNSIEPGDRINIVGVFKVKDESGDDSKLVTTFLRNIEVWQTNDRDSRLVTDEETDSISTITVLLTDRQTETMTLAEDVSEKIRLVMANLDDVEDLTAEVDLPTLLRAKKPEPDVPKTQPVSSDNENSDDHQETATDSQTEKPKEKVQYAHRMKVFRGGEVLEFGFEDKNTIPKVIRKFSSASTTKVIEETQNSDDDDFADLPESNDEVTSGDNTCK